MDSPFRRASAVDVSRVLQLMRTYYREDGYPFDEALAARAVRELLANERLGWLWVIESGQKIVGYLAVTLGFSLEYRGRDAFIDELYLEPEARGKRLGTAALDVAYEACRAAGVHALHLEVERDKDRAIDFYRRAGFEDHDRCLMTKRVIQRVAH